MKSTKQPKESTVTRRDQLQKVYTFIVANWAVDAKDIENAKIVEPSAIKSLLRTLTNTGGLVAGEHINGERTLTYQSMFDIENEDNVLKRAQEAFDAAFPVEVKDASEGHGKGGGKRYSTEQLEKVATARKAGKSWKKACEAAGIPAVSAYHVSRVFKMYPELEDLDDLLR